VKLYLAAQFSWKERIAECKKTLEAQGHTITSTWTEENANPNCSLKDYEGNYHAEMANRDLLEIEAADGIVLFSVDPDEYTRRGGRHVEFGYALGLGKEIHVVGPKENIFHHLPKVKQFDDWGYFLEYIYGK
jgi:nucleoside 2-deoxyribosyltransferase